MADSVKVREAAAAGRFYPLDSAELAGAVQGYMAEADPRRRSNREFQAVLAPHAGHIFCGGTTGQAFVHLKEQRPGRILLFGPSHYLAFHGIALSSVESFATPMGEFPVDTVAVQRLLDRWGKRSSREHGDHQYCEIHDAAHEPEHSLEVILPFVAVLWGNLPILPMLSGKIAPEQAAEIIGQELREGDLLIISSDLSHFYPAGDAVMRDNRLLSAFDRGDAEGVAAEEACGMTAILTAMHIAAARGWLTEITGYSHSGLLSGDMSRVVGYGSAVMFREA